LQKEALTSLRKEALSSLQKEALSSLQKEALSSIGHHFRDQGVNIMKTISTPIRTTIVFGLIGGFFFVPLAVGFSYVLPWSTAFCLTIWIYLAIYSVLLIKYCGKEMAAITFPLLIALLTVIWTDSLITNLIIVAGVFSWIRSGICYPNQFTKRVTAEIVLCAGGVFLIAAFTPISVLNWAIAIWLFILIQALYFVIFENSFTVAHKFKKDPFEAAREQAENILAAGL
jgi:hypothetical protein